jgi:hypothetical protein
MLPASGGTPQRSGRVELDTVLHLVEGWTKTMSWGMDWFDEALVVEGDI